MSASRDAGPEYPPGSPLDMAAQQNGRCGECGQALLHPDSIAAGICARHRELPPPRYPNPAEMTAAGGR